MDVRQISLRDAQGQELLKNGNFRDGGTYWTYTSDDRLGWHMKNLALVTWFSWELPDALSLGAFLTQGISRSAKSCFDAQTMVAAWLTTLIGFLAVSALDTLIETPRFLKLLLLLVWAGLPATSQAASSFEPWPVVACLYYGVSKTRCAAGKTAG